MEAFLSLFQNGFESRFFLFLLAVNPIAKKNLHTLTRFITQDLQELTLRFLEGELLEFLR